MSNENILCLSNCLEDENYAKVFKNFLNFFYTPLSYAFEILMLNVKNKFGNVDNLLWLSTHCSKLKKNQQLNEENLLLIVENFEHASELIEGLTYLKEKQIATKENIDVIKVFPNQERQFQIGLVPEILLH